MATESWAQPDSKQPLAQGQKAALSTPLALVVAAVIPSCGATRIQPAPAGISPSWMMWSVGAVVVIALGVLVLMACAKEKKKRPEFDSDRGSAAAPEVPMASNPSYSTPAEAVPTYRPKPEPGSSGEVLYQEINHDVPGGGGSGGGMYTTDGQEQPQYAVVKTNNTPAPVEDPYNIAMTRTRGEPKPAARPNEPRDIYGNSGAIFQNVIIPASQVTLKEVLDSGQFGEVMSGTWTGPDGRRDIAAKTIKGTVSAEDKASFIEEATMMSQLVHANVLGVLAVTEEPLMLIMEKVSERSLKSYIEQQGYNHESPIPFPTLLEFTKQTAQGMEYLSEHGIVHRDIAARNMLLNVESRTEFTVKVADFGLSKVTTSTFHSKTGDSKVPIPTRWTSLEALYKGLWSSKSDVWSWAVMTWELTTHGQFPYTLVWDDKPTIEKVTKGMRLHQAELLPDELYKLLMKCWATSVDRRPKFGQIAAQLQELSDRIAGYKPDRGSFSVIDRSVIEAELEGENTQASNRRKPAAATVPSMYFFLPSAPVFVEAPRNAAEDALFYKVMPPDDEDPVFIPANSEFAQDLIAGQSTQKYMKQIRTGKPEMLKIGKDDLLPSCVYFVRQRGTGTMRSLYAPPAEARRQSMISMPARPRAADPSPDGPPGLPTRKYNRLSARESAGYGKLLADKKGRKPYTKYSESAGKRMQELIGSNFGDLGTESTDHGYINNAKMAAVPAPAEVGYVNHSAGHRYENSSGREISMSAAEKAMIIQWFDLSKVVREDAEAALQGTPAGSFVVRKKSFEATDFVITMYLGPLAGQFKHYRLKASGPTAEHSLEMIDTVNGNMNFPSLWELLDYYRSHVPGKKRALPIRLGSPVPPIRDQ